MVILISWFFQKNRHFSETLWKFFKYRPLPIYLLDKFANIYSKHVVWTVCPTVMQWTSHKQSSKVVAEDSHQFVLSLNEQQELEALGLLLQLCVPPIIALILMLLEVSECSSPLGLVLQKRWWLYLPIWSANIYWNNWASII